MFILEPKPAPRQMTMAFSSGGAQIARFLGDWRVTEGRGSFSAMRVIFRRTGERRYAVVVEVPGQARQTMNPAPGFDPHIPHDLVHYAVEATLGLEAAVFGRAARGGGTFYAAETSASSRDQARRRRKQARREQGLRRERANEKQLQTSERIAYLSDIAWRRRHGQRPNPSYAGPSSPISALDAERVEQVVSRLDELAPQWNQLATGGELTFNWPGLTPVLGCKKVL